ncbi:ATP-binding protein [Paludibaculum fermentans]|uniref:sensor histidine kinase n=1 Tax=Paludibaculum fermentans TaxID=1473598 RepID=UPI003EBFC132
MAQASSGRPQSAAQPAGWFDTLLRLDRRVLLGVSIPLTLLVALLDWRTGPDVAIGAAYLFPVMLLSIGGTRWQILLLSLTCAAARGFFSVWYSPVDFFLRYLLAFAAYSATGLLISEILKHHAETRLHLDALREQNRLRQELEEHLRELAESSPAAIFTSDALGRILTANEEARHLFGLPQGVSLRGASVVHFLPVLEGALRLDPSEGVFRTSTQCQGRRLGGEPFFAQVWFSLYANPGGRRLAVIAVDISDDMREREDQNLRLLASQNRIIAGAVSHEVRNICGAIAMAVNSLKESGALSDTREASTLGELVAGLMRIAATDLEMKAEIPLSPLHLADLFDQLRVLIEPAWADLGGAVDFRLEPGLPRVLANSAALIQVFLNLANNSLRAVEHCDVKLLTITASQSGPEIHIRVADTGSGLPLLPHLFEPFQEKASGAGLGLYVSRAVLRNYGGDLKHEPSSEGCVFCVKLPAAA